MVKLGVGHLERELDLERSFLLLATSAVVVMVVDMVAVVAMVFCTKGIHWLVKLLEILNAIIMMSCISFLPILIFYIYHKNKIR